MQNKTPDFTVETNTNYLPEQSDVSNHKFVWSYEIVIYNGSEDIVQLLNRYWKITEMNGKVEEVSGPGVVGLQPLIKPGKRFTYSSFCQLTTPQGTMEGFFEMQNLEEMHFNIDIPKFILSAPSSITKGYRFILH